MEATQERRPDGSFLTDDLVRQLVAAGQVDILVGIPTYNNAATIDHVVRAVQAGMAKYFRRDRAVLLAADGGSSDGTVDAVKGSTILDYRPLMTASPLRTFHHIAARYRGIPGRWNALRTVLASAELLGAKTIAIVGGELQSITPEWIESLVRPIYSEGFDLVTPLYRRHKFDALLIKNVVYPVVQAVFGKKVREPIGGELGLSGRFASHCLEAIDWGDEQRNLGGELQLTCAAMVEDFRICQAVLGAKFHAGSETSPALASVVQQVIGCLFECMEEYESFWIERQGVEDVPTFGFEYDVALERVRVNRKRMMDHFRHGLTELGPILEDVMGEETLSRVRALAQKSDRMFRFPDELWAKTVYEFAASYHHGIIHRGHIVQALSPLYLGRVCSTVLETLDADPRSIERRLEELCEQYQRFKPYLIEQWNAPRRR